MCVARGWSKAFLRHHSPLQVSAQIKVRHVFRCEVPGSFPEVTAFQVRFRSRNWHPRFRCGFQFGFRTFRCGDSEGSEGLGVSWVLVGCGDFGAGFWWFLPAVTLSYHLFCWGYQLGLSAIILVYSCDFLKVAWFWDRLLCTYPFAAVRPQVACSSKSDFVMCFVYLCFMMPPSSKIPMTAQHEAKKDSFCDLRRGIFMSVLWS